MSTKSVTKSATKPATKPATAKGTEPAPAPIVDENASRTRPATQKRARVKRNVAFLLQLQRMLRRANRIAQRSNGWFSETDAAMASASRGLEQAASAFAAIPADWTPPAKVRTPRAVVALAPEQVVAIAARSRKRYTDVLAAEEMDGMVVIRITGKQVVCRTINGDRVILPRGHLAVSGGDTNADAA